VMALTHALGDESSFRHLCGLVVRRRVFNQPLKALPRAISSSGYWPQLMKMSGFSARV
jgi:hypothetical protein